MGFKRIIFRNIFQRVLRAILDYYSCYCLGRFMGSYICRGISRVTIRIALRV